MKAIYTADFETTGSNFFNKYKRSEVRIIGLSKEMDEKSNSFNCRYFYNMRDFLVACSKLERENSIIYFCNLKFDGEFILKSLKENLDLIDAITPEDDVNNKIYAVGDPYVLQISTNSRIMEIAIRFHTDKVVKFRCLFALYGTHWSVKKMGEYLNIPKIEEDVKKYDITEAEFKAKGKRWIDERKKYLRTDIKIPYFFIHKDILRTELGETTPFSFRKIPLSASGFGEKAIKSKDPFLFNHFFTGTYDKETKTMDYYFNKITIQPWLNYRGGFTFINTKYANRTLENVICLDINSSYPSQYTIHNMPCKAPKIYDEMPKFKKKSRLYAYWCEFKNIKFKGDIEIFPPFFPKADANRFGRFIINYNGEVIKLLVWEEEMEFYKKYYDFDLKINLIYEFETTNILKKWTEEFVKAKFESENEAKIQTAKLVINSFYGKFGQKYKMDSNFYNIETGEWDIITNTEENVRHYNPVASFITMKGRMQLYHQIEKLVNLGVKVYYGDTDSIKCSWFDIDKYKGYLNIGNDLGEWKYEGIYSKFKYLASKSYLFEKNGIIDYVIKGYNGKEKIDFETFKYGMTLANNLKSMRVKGGVILEMNDYFINDLDYLIYL